MTIVCIDGKQLDTDKARSWDLSFHDGNNMHSGALYLSSKGTWYCYTPSQWGNGHRWETGNPADLIEWYGKGLSEEDLVEILEAAGIETE